MKISGLQKTTLVDYPGNVACTIFLFGCNFRCGFCYNPDIVLRDSGESFSEGEILDFLNKRKGKLDAVCITGGEPLMTLDFNFVKEIRKLGYKVKIDTNGSFPKRLIELIDEGLVDYIAMDIKSRKEDYSIVCGTNVSMDDIEESIKIVSEFPSHEFRTTVVGRFHDAYNLREMGRWLNSIIGNKEKIFLQGFKKNGGTIDPSFSEEKDLAEKELGELKECLDEYFEEVVVRG